MALILVHSPKGGVGATFVTAHLAQAFARQGRDATAVDFTDQDALKLFFGLLPHQAAPDPYAEPMMMDGVRLVRAKDMDPLEADVAAEALTQGDGVVIADIAARDSHLRNALMGRAAMHLCVLAPEPLSLASLTQLNPDQSVMDMAKTAFVLNRTDDRRRLSRHSHQFVRELFQDRMIGVVRRDEAANEALAMFEPLDKLAPHSVVLGDFDLLATAALKRIEAASAPKAKRPAAEPAAAGPASGDPDAKLRRMG